MEKRRKEGKEIKKLKVKRQQDVNAAYTYRI